MRTKSESIELYFDKYTDEYKRFCLYTRDKYKRGSYDNENPHLFTGYMCILFDLLEYKDTHFDMCLFSNLDAAQVPLHTGLYGRQPYGNNTDNVVSHDEYNGIMFQFIRLGQFTKADHVVKYGMKNRWSYNDLDPLKFHLRYRRQPRDIAFYKIVSRSYNPSCYEVVYLGLSFIVSALGSKGNVSGELQVWYKYQAIKLRGYKSKTLDISYRIFKYLLKKELGENWLSSLHKIYFKDSNHPIHTLARGLEDL